MKTVVLERDVEGSGQHRVHAGFPDYAKHGGFAIQRCRPDRARTQGAWSACRATAPGSPSRRDDSVTPFASYYAFDWRLRLTAHNPAIIPSPISASDPGSGTLPPGGRITGV